MIDKRISFRWFKDDVHQSKIVKGNTMRTNIVFVYKQYKNKISAYINNDLLC